MRIIKPPTGYDLVNDGIVARGDMYLCGTWWMNVTDSAGDSIGVDGEWKPGEIARRVTKKRGVKR
jgi:hypothetical protein